MLIVCPNCTASYRIELSALGPQGRNVRCARCKEIWHASALDAVTADFPADTQGAGQTSEARPPEPHRASQSAPPTAPPARLRDNSGAGDFDGTAPSIVPGLDEDAPARVPSPTDSAGGTDIETAAATRYQRARILRRTTIARTRRLWPVSALTTAILVMSLLAALALEFRQTVVRHASQTAGFYAAFGMPVNLRGLAFENVKLTRETSDGITVLALEGLIVNTMNLPARVPRLRYSVLDRSGQEKYAWTALPAEEVLAGGDALPFTTRLASPPTDGAEILVRFFNRRDAVETLRPGEQRDGGDARGAQ